MGSCGGVRDGASEARSGEWGGGQRRAPVALLEPQARPAGQRASLSASRGGRGLPLGYDGRSSQGHDFLHHKEGAVRGQWRSTWRELPRRDEAFMAETGR
jgi:hypothetical protein